MKKFFKYYLPTLIIIGASGVFLLGYMIFNQADFLKYLAGKAGYEVKGNIFRANTSAVVREDGVEQSRIKVFEDDGKIYLVFDKVSDSGSGVLIVDKAKKDIYAPNMYHCFEMIFSRYLFQAECGQRGDYLSGEKHQGYQVKLESNDSQINFQLPEYSYGESVKLKRNRQMEIIFKDK